MAAFKLVLFPLVLAFVIALISMMPTIVIDVDTVVNSSVFYYLRAAGYFIPVNTVVGIGSIILGFWVFRVLVALIRTIWDMLPLA